MFSVPQGNVAWMEIKRVLFAIFLHFPVHFLLPSEASTMSLKGVVQGHKNKQFHEEMFQSILPQMSNLPVSILARRKILLPSLLTCGPNRIRKLGNLSRFGM